MKKVLIISPSYLPVPAIKGGAIESLVDEFLRYNSISSDFEITIYSKYSTDLTPDIINEYRNTNFRYIKNKGFIHFLHRIISSIDKKIHKKKQNPTKYARDVIYDIKRRKELNNYDLVIVENQIESLIFYRKYIKSKMVNHLHNNLLNTKTKEAKKVVKTCDEFFGVSKFICNEINSIDDNIVTKVLYNGVDMKKYIGDNITESQKEEILKKIGFNKNDFIIIFVGRIFKQKGVRELVEAFNKIKKDNDHMKLLIVGSKVGDSKENNDYYNNIIEQSNQSNGSIYVYGYAKLEELKILYSIASLQVVPSVWDEAFGLIVVEGMCNMKKIIASNSGGIPEIVGNSTIIVNKNNLVEELSNAIIKVYSHPENYKVDENEYKKIINKFDISNYCKRFVELINEIIK